MSNIAVTNKRIYLEIAEESYQLMQDALAVGRVPKEDGSEGYILKHDPNSVSFKQAMISVVFTGMWIEALTHVLIVKNHGVKKFKEIDFKGYEVKLQLLGVTCPRLQDKVKALRLTRKELIHEKAFLDNGMLKTAQQEAELAQEVRSLIIGILGK